MFPFTSQLVIILIFSGFYSSNILPAHGITCECTTESCIKENMRYCQAKRHCFREYLQESIDKPLKFSAKGCVMEKDSLMCDENLQTPGGTGPRLYTECCNSHVCNNGTTPSLNKLNKYMNKIRNNELLFNKMLRKSVQSTETINSVIHDSLSPSSSNLFDMTKYPLTIVIIIASISGLSLFIFLILAIVKLITFFTFDPSNNQYQSHCNQQHHNQNLPFWSPSTTSTVIPPSSSSSSSSLLISPNSLCKHTILLLTPNSCYPSHNMSKPNESVYNISLSNSDNIETNTISTDYTTKSPVLYTSCSSSSSSSSTASTCPTASTYFQHHTQNQQQQHQQLIHVTKTPSSLNNEMKRSNPPWYEKLYRFFFSLPYKGTIINS